MYRSIRAPRGFTAREATSSRECIMNQLVIIVSAILLVTVFGCGRKTPLNDDSVERGKYLVTLGGCNDCHTPKVSGPDGAPVLDTKRLLSGHPENVPPPMWTPEDAKQRNVLATTNDMLTAWAGPWGVSFASNLTPDQGTGMGEWAEARLSKSEEQANTRVSRMVAIFCRRCRGLT
jgi:mono/diheme cytochrome c family protein